jgi:hypothetical protein
MSERNKEYNKLMELLKTYELILHPNIFNALIKQIGEVEKESVKNAYAEAKISDNALLIEKRIIELKASFEQHPSQKRFFLKCFYKDLTEVFLK